MTDNKCAGDEFGNLNFGGVGKEETQKRSMFFCGGEVCETMKTSAGNKEIYDL